ncbi:MAG: carbohydrate kinase family protein, partial [Propionibacteriaceae bacterium]|nr:carbohydrate kinase family protein [Propionibacteriaceae bacterium]
MAIVPTFFVGDISLDRYYRAGAWPVMGDRVAMDVLEEQIGGMVANAARVHAGFGQPTEFISILNNGQLTQELKAGLLAANVGISHLAHHDDEPDPQTVVIMVGDEDVIFWANPSTLPIPLRADTLEALTCPGYLYSTAGRLARLVGPAGESAAQVLHTIRQAGRELILDLDADGLQLADSEFARGAHTVLMNEHGFTRSAIADKTAWLDGHEITELIVTL